MPMRDLSYPFGIGNDTSLQATFQSRARNMWLPYVAGPVGGTDGDAHSPKNPEGRAGGGNMRAVSHFRILVLNREKAILLDFPGQHCGVVMRGVGNGGGGGVHCVHL